MTILRLAAWSTAALCAFLSAAQAGSCSKDIDAMQARFDARLDAIAGAGPAARQSLGADLSHQPTPRSIAAAEVKLGELNQHVVRSVRRALNRARVADARGNTRRCEKELARAERALRPVSTQ
jgi:membrane-bound lytic murein transglycosylase B